MAEDYEELKPASPWDELEKTEFCLEGVRQAECFVAVVTSRHGSRITVPGAGIVPTSFFEAELFEAALLRKPSIVFLLKGHTPDSDLTNLLKLLAPAFPGMSLDPASEDEIVRQINLLVDNYKRPKLLRHLTAPPRIGLMVDRSFAARHRPYAVASDLPPWRFLNRRFDPSATPTDPSLVKLLLDRVDGTHAYQARLTLLWFAIRALIGAPYDDPAHAHLRSLWVRTLEAWNSSAAWYGLHGPALMSCLACLGSLAEIATYSPTATRAAPAVPHGALASEYYSTAKLASRGAIIFDLALAHVEQAIATTAGDTANQKAVRGSIYLQTGRIDAALKDYREVVTLRESRGGASYGEALSELGYALLLAGKRAEGIDKMENGLVLLRAESASGFQVRAMRKLAVGYARCLKFSAALSLAAEAHDLAVDLSAYDQIHTLERLASMVDRLRPWPRSTGPT